MRSLTRNEVRSVDRIAIEQMGISGLVLMENAGRNAADAIEQFIVGRRLGLCWWLSPGQPAPEASRLTQSKIAVVAGAGNNGGDGFVVARHLAMRGAKVTTYLVAAPEKISGDAAANLAILKNSAGDVRQLTPNELNQLAMPLAQCDLVVDAIGGTGIRGPTTGDVALAVEQVNSAGRPVVAIDIPTGLDCDTGLAPGPAIRANLTVTFVARKKGFDLPGAPAFTGDVIVADIGVAPEIALHSLPDTNL